MAHIHTNYEGHIINIICKHTLTQPHTQTLTDRQTDRRTHTHILNHLPEPFPSVEVSQYRAVCARHQILHEGEEKATDQGSTQHLGDPFATTNAQATSMHVYTYLPSPFIPKIKAQFPTTYGILSMYSHYTHPV